MSPGRIAFLLRMTTNSSHEKEKNKADLKNRHYVGIILTFSGFFPSTFFECEHGFRSGKTHSALTSTACVLAFVPQPSRIHGK